MEELGTYMPSINVRPTAFTLLLSDVHNIIVACVHAMAAGNKTEQQHATRGTKTIAFKTSAFSRKNENHRMVHLTVDDGPRVVAMLLWPAD